MKAIVENPLNVNHSPVAISLYVNMLNRITWCKAVNVLFLLNSKNFTL